MKFEKKKFQQENAKERQYSWNYFLDTETTLLQKQQLNVI